MLQVPSTPPSTALPPPALVLRLHYSNKLRGFSPQANYTDLAAAACRRSQCQLLAARGCCVVSAMNPHSRWFQFSRPGLHYSLPNISCYIFHVGEHSRGSPVHSYSLLYHLSSNPTEHIQFYQHTSHIQFNFQLLYKQFIHI
jgi:hypothetical protein